MMGMSVRVHGKIYASAAHAASDLGLSRGTIWAAIREGREDTVGTFAKPTLRKPCRINGKWYESMSDAANDNCVSVAAISQAIRDNRWQVRRGKTK